MFSRFILHRAGRLEQLDHSRNLSRFFFLSGRSPGTIRLLAKPFSRFILHRAGHLEQLDYLRNSSRFFFLLGRSPGKIRPLVKPFSCFISHRAGRLEQLDHSQNPFRILFLLSGRLPGTIRSLAKPFAFFYYQAGRPKQFDLFQKKKMGRLLKDLFLDFNISLLFSKFSKTLKKKQKFVVYLLFFINLLRKAKRKQNFLISLHSKYYKEMTTVRIQFFTLLF
jgi:hypothetical protein